MTFTCSMTSAPGFVAEILRRHARDATRNSWAFELQAHPYGLVWAKV